MKQVRLRIETQNGTVILRNHVTIKDGESEFSVLKDYQGKDIKNLMVSVIKNQKGKNETNFKGCS